MRCRAEDPLDSGGGASRVGAPDEAAVKQQVSVFVGLLCLLAAVGHGSDSRFFADCVVGHGGGW